MPVLLADWPLVIRWKVPGLLKQAQAVTVALQADESDRTLLTPTQSRRWIRVLHEMRNGWVDWTPHVERMTRDLRLADGTKIIPLYTQVTGDPDIGAWAFAAGFSVDEISVQRAKGLWDPVIVQTLGRLAGV